MLENYHSKTCHRKQTSCGKTDESKFKIILFGDISAGKT